MVGGDNGDQTSCPWFDLNVLGKYIYPVYMYGTTT
jgi:hypothetical protein